MKRHATLDTASVFRALQRHGSWEKLANHYRKLLRKEWRPQNWIAFLCCLDHMGDFIGIRSELQNRKELLDQQGLTLHPCRMYFTGRVFQAFGEYGRALVCYAQASAVFPQGEERTLLAIQTATINYFNGNTQAAIMGFNRACQDAAKSRQWGAMAHALDLLCMTHLREGQCSEAHKAWKAASKAAARAGDINRQTWLLFSKGCILHCQGKTELGIQLMKQAADEFKNLGCPVQGAFIFTELADKSLARQENSAALQHYLKAWEMSAGLHWNSLRARIARGLSGAYAKSGEKAQSVSWANRGTLIRKYGLKALDTADEERILNKQDILKFIKGHDPDGFECLCLAILTHHGFQCERTPEGTRVFDAVARQRVDHGTKSKEILWGVQCKQWFSKNITHNNLPRFDLADSSYTGFILMTAGRIRTEAKDALDIRRTGRTIDAWDIDKLSAYLFEHQSIMIDFGHNQRKF